MRILNINTYDSGGAAISCIRQHISLLDQGIESHLLTLYSSGRTIPNHLKYGDLINRPYEHRSLIKRLKNRLRLKLNQSAIREQVRLRENIYQLQDIASKSIDLFSLISSDCRIEEIPNIEDYDIINLHWTAQFIHWGSFFSSSKVKKIVWTLHDMNPFTGGYHYASGYEGYNEDDVNPPFLKGSFNHNFAAEQLATKKEILSKSKIEIKVVSPSKWLMECSKKSTLFRDFEHALIPYSLDTSIFKPLEKGFCRDVLNLPKDKKIILFVSQNLANQRKGFDVLLESFSLFDKSDDILLCCIGAINDVLLNSLNIFSLGFVEDERIMALAYNAADLFVLPSKEDNLPNVVLESLCCGTPVVGFRIGGMPDMVEDGFNGMLCNTIGSSELSHTIQIAMNNIDNFNRNDISIRAKKKYSCKNQANSYLKLYKSFK